MVFGRDGELELLCAAYQQIAHEPVQARLMVVTGEAGMGKTSLCEAAARQFESLGALVLGGSCPRPRGVRMAYAPFVSAWQAAPVPVEGFASLLAGVARLDGEPPDVAQAWLCGQVLEQLAEWARKQPVVLMVDDAHWIDPASLNLLHAIATTRAPQRLLLIVSARTDDDLHGPAADFVQLATRPNAHHLELGPLPDDAIRDLIICARGDVDDIDSLVRRAAGHPLFAAELARHRSTGLPASLRVLLGQRMRELGGEGGEFLAAVALAGDDAHEEFLASTGQADPAAKVHQGIELGLLTRDTPAAPIRPRHPLFAEAAVAELAPTARLHLQSRVAQAFDGIGAPAKAAWHWEQAGDRQRALHCWHLGGLAATARHAYAEAAEAHLRALALHDTLAHPPNQPDRATVVLAAATALRWSGRPDEAASLLRRGLVTVPPENLEMRAELLCRLWDCRFISGNRAEAYETLAEARALAADLPDSPLTARLAAAEGARLMHLGRYAAGAERARVAAGHAERVSDRATQAYALSTLGVCLAFTGMAGEAVEVLDQARTLAHRIGSVRELVRAAGNLTYVLANTGQHDRVTRVGHEALSRLDGLGLAGALGGPLRYNVAVSLVALGRWDQLCEAERDVDERLPAGKRARIRLCLAEIAALRGEHEPAAELLATASAIIDGPDALFEAERAIPAAVAARAAGRHRGAIDICRQALANAAEGLGPIERLRLAAEGLGALADLQVARGRFTRIACPEAVSAELLSTVRSGQCDTPEEVALCLVCEAEASRLDRTDAGMWLKAAEAWDLLGMVYHAAHARMRQAETLVAQGDPQSAAEPLRHAFATATQLRATPLNQAVERVARQGRLALPGAPQTDSPAMPAAPETPHLTLLTRREREVLELVGWGRTNREIAGALVLSERTVGVHVSRILAKLGVSNRSEAARIAWNHPATKHT